MPSGLLDWHTSRAMECLLEMLGYDEESHTLLFTGLIQYDGYSAYSTLTLGSLPARIGTGPPSIVHQEYG